jgi:hypothetical protein
VTTHILAEELTERAVREALRGGRAYVAHDWLCDPTGFAVGAWVKGARRAAMGDEVALSSGLKIRVESPVRSILKLFHNGEEVVRTIDDNLDFEPVKTGVYRLEAWLEVDGEERPWVYANPIYVR